MTRLLALLLAAWTPCLGSCAHSYELERRDTPLHVWLTAPEMAARGGQMQALIYVGPYKVVEGPVVFPQGVSTVRLPSLHVRTGSHRVSVVLRGGRPSLAQDIVLEREAWLHVVVRGAEASLQQLEKQPILSRN